MKPLTKERVDKAEGDYESPRREFRARKAPNYDSSCFHSQQSAEKYLKARLQEAHIRFGKTHDLEELINLCLPVEPLWSVLFPSAKTLNDFAVLIRYPGRNATKLQAKDALKRCGDFRTFARQSLGLKA